MTRISSSGTFLPGWDGYGPALAGYYSDRTSVCADPNGGVFATYAYVGNGALRVHLTHFGPDGQRLCDVELSNDNDNEDKPMAVADGAGGVYVVWEDWVGASPRTIRAQHVIGGGEVSPGWPATGLTICSSRADAGTVNFYDANSPYYRESATSDATGGLYVAWADHRASASEGDIYVQHLRGDGTIAAGWPIDGRAVCTEPGDQRLPTVAGDGNGGLLIAWQDHRGSDNDIYAQRVIGSGMAGSPAGGLPVCTASGDQVTPQIVADGTGGAIVAWGDGRSAPTQIHALRVAFDPTLGTTTPPASGTLVLGQPLPNPASGFARVQCSLPDASSARIEVFDVSGRRVWSTEVVGSGSHQIPLFGAMAPTSGVYLVRLTNGTRSVARRLLVVD